MQDYFQKVRSQGLEHLNKSSSHYLFNHLDMRFTAIGDNWLEVTMPVTEKVLQPMKILHGGVNLLLGETIASIGSFSLLNDPKEFIVGTELSGSHLRSCRVGDTVKARAILIQGGRQLHRWRFEFENQDGKATFVGMMTVMVQKTQ